MRSGEMFANAEKESDCLKCSEKILSLKSEANAEMP